jgi:alpha-ketoglutarate-dependent taurine dioxygenase
MDQFESMKPDVTKPGATKRRTISLSRESLVKESVLRVDTALPLLIGPAVDGVSLIDWAASSRALVEQKLLSYGAILFRGFNLSAIDDFERFMQTLAGDLLDYAYRSTPRTRVSGRVYTSTEYPAHQTIPLHNEMSYSRSWPRVLGFFCVEAAPEGGETPIADSRKVFKAIDPAIRDRFSEKGVMYVRNYGDALDLSWQNVFQTEDRAAVEAFCRNAGIEFEWKGENELRTRQVCQAVATHPDTGEMVWFNQAHLFHVSSLEAEVREALLASSGGEPPRNAYYGDGSTIEDEVLDEIRAVYVNEAVAFPWQKGDIMVVDNVLTAHGRQPYRGARRIVVGMG